MTGVRSPALGLALVVWALRTLPQPLRLLANALLPYGSLREINGLAIINAVALLLQLAAGIACIRRERAAPALLWAWLAAMGVLTVCAGFVLGDAHGLELAGMLVELVGFPALILIAARFVPASETRTAADAGAVLFASGLTALASAPVAIAGTIQLLRASTSYTAGAVVGQLLPFAISLLVGGLAVAAGRRLVRTPAEARPLLRAYAIAAIVLQGAFVVLTIVVTFLEGSIAPRYVVAIELISLVYGVGVPVTVWLYARDRLDAAPHPVTVQTAAWIALAFAPSLASRVVLLHVIAAATSIAAAALFVSACGVLAFLLAFVAVRALRDLPARAAAIGACVLAAAFHLLAAYAALSERLHKVQIGPSAALLGATLTLAWLARRRGTHATM